MFQVGENLNAIGQKNTDAVFGLRNLIIDQMDC